MKKIEIEAEYTLGDTVAFLHRVAITSSEKKITIVLMGKIVGITKIIVDPPKEDGDVYWIERQNTKTVYMVPRSLVCWQPLQAVVNATLENEEIIEGYKLRANNGQHE